MSAPGDIAIFWGKAGYLTFNRAKLETAMIAYMETPEQFKETERVAMVSRYLKELGWPKQDHALYAVAAKIAWVNGIDP